MTAPTPEQTVYVVLGRDGEPLGAFANRDAAITSYQSRGVGRIVPMVVER